MEQYTPEFLKENACAMHSYVVNGLHNSGAILSVAPYLLHMPRLIPLCLEVCGWRVQCHTMSPDIPL